MADQCGGLHSEEIQTEGWIQIIGEPGEAAFIFPTRLIFSERSLQLAIVPI